MSNAAVTQQILQAVDYAKSRAKSAEQNFDSAHRAVQRKASQSIDLFGGSAHSTVANIARDVRRACDDLYSAYQSLIVTLDETCRPLLSADPDVLAVKAVAELMKKLNDDSEIETNFTASLNGSSMGDVGASRYVPSMNCKMIQRYWEDRYATWPGRAEQEAAARQKEQDRRREAEERANKEYEAQMQRYEQQMQQYEQRMQEYRKEHAQWDTEVKRITAKRASELASRQNAYKQKKLENLLDTYNKSKREAEKKQKRLEGELEKARTDLAQAGFFAFGAKRTAKQTIKEKSMELDHLQISMRNAEQTYQADKENVASELKDREASVKSALEREYPLPKAPTQPFKPTKPIKPRPAVTPNRTTTSYSSPSTNFAIEALKQAILDSMEVGEKYTISDIIMTCPEVADLTNQRVAALVRQLVSSGDLIRTEDERRAYFELA